MDLDRARAFVHEHGDDVQIARLEALRSRRAATALPPVLVTTQNPDGGWAFGRVAGHPSALHETAQALEAIADLGLLATPAATAGLAFIAARQNRRGVWRESAELASFEPPLWQMPGETAADIYTTALCASTQAQFSDNGLPVDRALAWLQTQQGREGLLPGFKLHSSWLAVPAFVEGLGREARATRRIVAGLGEALNHEWSGAMLAACLYSMLAAGYTTQTRMVARGWEMLQAKQQADGSVTTDEGEDAAEATFQAIAVAWEINREQRR